LEVPIKEVAVDISFLKSVRSTVSEINSLTSKLDMVINNTAVNFQDYLLTDERIEMHFGTNHASLFFLTNMIMPIFDR
jgi:NAD(P)-dependent dehydrogenase (short-subunit alcohol dehydrogenase family)